MFSKELLIARKHLVKHDIVMQTIIKKYGNINLQPNRKYFISLLKAIVSQQLSTASAKSITDRVFDHFKGKVTPEKIFNCPNEKLRELGLSNAKTKYIKDLAQKLIEKSMSFRGINKKSNPEIIEMLSSVKGIGVWTSHMFLIFTLCRLNILPVGDLGIRRAVMLNYGLRKLPVEQQIPDIARKNNWAPYESVASWYLWKSLENK